MEWLKTLISRPSKGVSGKTGYWRTFKPIYDRDKCVLCYECYVYCPENCVEIVEKVVKIDYDFCKGCGICSEVCPANAIEMVKED